LGRGMEAAVSPWLRRGQGLQSEKMGGGREGQTLQTRKRGGGAPFLSCPQDGRAKQNREPGELGSGKVYPGKAWHLRGWEDGGTEATVQVPRNPRRGCLSPRPPHRPDPSKLRLGLGRAMRVMVEVRTWLRVGGVEDQGQTGEDRKEGGQLGGGG
jgi:hypothetical protein